MSFFGFGAGPDIEITLDGEDSRKKAVVRTEGGKQEAYPLYLDGETVSGEVKMNLRKGSKYEHLGVKVELLGQIEVYYDRGNQDCFLTLHRELARPGDLLPNQIFKFEFPNVEKPYETYTGANVKLRYIIRVSISKRLSLIVKEKEFVVQTLAQYPDVNNSIKMEVGIEDCLHIEFEYNRSKYHLKDVIVGKIYFLLVRIKIKHMELAIIKRETTGTGPNTVNENETIAKFEIMDGAPVKGESIPIRVFLSGYDLTPTMRDVNKKFSVRYYLNLVLVDEEERRYFKQQEIILWRKMDRSRKTFQAELQQQYKEMQNPNIQFSSADPSEDALSAENDESNLTNTDETSPITNGKSGLESESSAAIDITDEELVNGAAALQLDDDVEG
ncbi:Vacuolar protein sorting-associated protein 26B [Orchesella cincta]|uniref:Vacuolar protein sorting-associated protein 26B n=1 Tax=Orchesella cincta TaxID=48709 RepID=A0A1D2MFU1_ORCCI|nr:Vacuolar protein sorting-associated protein 26B [Orchesella cincta]